GGQTHTRQDGPENRSAARDVVLSGKEATIASGSSASCCNSPLLATNRFSFRIGGFWPIELGWMFLGFVDSAGTGNRMKKCRPARRHISFRRVHDTEKQSAVA